MGKRNHISDPTDNIPSKIFAELSRKMPSTSFEMTPIHETLSLAVSKFIERVVGEKGVPAEWATLRAALEAQEAALAALRAENSRLRHFAPRRILVIADDVLETVFLFYNRRRLETVIRKICRRWDSLILTRFAQWPKYNFSCVTIDLTGYITFETDDKKKNDVAFERMFEEWARRSFEYLRANKVYIMEDRRYSVNVRNLLLLSEMQKMWPHKKWPSDIRIKNDDDLEKIERLDLRIKAHVHVTSSWQFQGNSIFKFPLIRNCTMLYLSCPSENFQSGEVDSFAKFLYIGDKHDDGYKKVEVNNIRTVEMLEELVNAIRTAFFKKDRKRKYFCLVCYWMEMEELPPNLRFENKKTYTNGHSTLTYYYSHITTRSYNVIAFGEKKDFE